MYNKRLLIALAYSFVVHGAEEKVINLMVEHGNFSQKSYGEYIRTEAPPYLCHTGKEILQNHRICTTKCRSIHEAILKDDAEAVSSFLAVSTSSLEERNAFGCTPYQMAVRLNHNRISRLLEEHGATFFSGEEMPITTSLHRAAKNGRAWLVDLLLLHGADKDSQDRAQATALHYACWHGDLALCKILVAKGANPNKSMLWGITPLHLAAFCGFKEIVELLLSVSADFNAIDCLGFTPVHTAAVNGHVDVLNVLLSVGADFRKSDFRGATPLHSAAYHGYSEAALLLLSYGADLQALDTSNTTPVDRAIQQKHIRLSQKLLAVKRVGVLNSQKNEK